MMDPRISSAASSLPESAAPAAASTDDLFSEPSSRPIFEGRDDDWAPADGADARGLLDSAHTFCSRRCPIFNACVENECLVYRLEGRAQQLLVAGPAGNVGVLDEPTLGVV